MNSRNHSIVLFCSLFLVLLHVTSASALTRVIEEVDLVPTASGTEIQIRFNLPLRYVTHAPAQKGKLLQVEMRSLFSSVDLVELTGRKVFSWQPSAANPLRTLTYEGDNPGGPQLLLEFTRVVEYRFKGGSDPLRLTILLRTPTSPAYAQPKVRPGKDVAVKESSGTGAGRVTAVDLSFPYAINLESALKPVRTQLPESRADLRQYRLYTTEVMTNGQKWHRLRLGFFADKKSAHKVMLSLKKEFPDAWLTRTTVSERQNSAKVALFEPYIDENKQRTLPEKPADTRTLPVLSAERRQQLLDQAEASMVAGDYQRAALLYTGLLRAEDAATRQLAQEYLGLARDRGNQLAHAKAEYEKYLQLYPEGEGAARVRQRLTALVTARSAPRSPLRKARQQQAGARWSHEVYGSFSQFYYRDSLTTEDETLLAQSTLRTDLDFNTRSRSEKLDIRTTFIGGLENDFREGGDDELRVSSFYLDLAARGPELSVRLGRQSRSRGGVLGRFDGALASWQISERVGASLVGGFPVASTRDTGIDTDRPLYGLSFDLGTFANRWDINLFFINQQVDSLTDRRAVGGEVRYYEPTRSFFTLLDYDIFYDQLNTALFNGNLRLTDGTTLTLSADYRNSPILTTSNALQSQTTDSISALRDLFTTEEIYQLARDRTAISQTYTLGATHPLNAKLQVSGDFSVSRFGATPASGGVDAVAGTGNMFFYSLQLIGSSLIKQGDIAIIGLRYSDTNTSATWALNLNTRYPLTRQLRVNPKMLVDYRTNNDDSGHRWRFRPLLRIEYRWKRRLHFEFEGGGEWINETVSGVSSQSRDYFFTLGYRVDF